MMHEPKLTEAVYTKLYKDLTTAQKAELHLVFAVKFPAVTGETSFTTVFESMWNFYEICDSDVSVFRDCVIDVFNQNCDYYKELYDNYKKEYDYAVGNKRTMTRHDSSHSERTGYTASTGTGSTKEYDLPNKAVSESSENGYLTGKNESDNMEIGNDASNKDSTYDSEIVNVYDNEFLDLKKKYMQQIRNLFEEFAGRFSDCFIHLFS